MDCNERYLIEVLEDVGVEQGIIRQIIWRLAGHRVNIREKPIEHANIIETFCAMMKIGVKKSTAIRNLSQIYGKSEGTIRAIINNKRKDHDCQAAKS